MEKKNIIPCSLEQELAEKAIELETLRQVREEHLVDITLNRIADGVVSREADILKMMADGKGQCLNAVREVVVHEVLRSANGLLWCPEYDERSKSDQRVMAFSGSHWQAVEHQQWKDFAAQCAERTGVPESQRMNHVFMKALFECLAYNVAEYRRQQVPDDEVWLNMRNGVLVLRKDGELTLREHRKEDLFRYTLPYCYDPQAECPQWQRFLDRVLPDADAQQLLAEFVGYCMMRGHHLEKMMLLFGEGLNGKSVTLEIIEALLGSMNVSYLSLSDLTSDEVKRAGFEGKMLNISHESGKDVNPNVLKQITSGERVLIRQLYHDPREVNDYGKLIAAFNVLPRAENTFGFFRRLIILPYQVTIPREEIDRQLAVKLKAELSGILNWVLTALPSLMTRGEFSPCESSDMALDQYRLQSDSVRLFLFESCETSEFTTPASELHTAYRNYCFESALKPIGKNKFYARLEELGHEPVLYGNLKYFKLKISEQ